MNKQQAAALLGMKTTEVVDVFDEDAGTVIHTKDGQALIVVPEDAPDAEGKTGLMWLAAPHAKYVGTFPVFAQPPATEDEPDDEEVAGDREDVDGEGDAQVGDVPGGPAAMVLAWVEDGPEEQRQARAAAALEAELGRAKPRQLLVAKLEALRS